METKCKNAHRVNSKKKKIRVSVFVLDRVYFKTIKIARNIKEYYILIKLPSVHNNPVLSLSS